MQWLDVVPALKRTDFTEWAADVSTVVGVVFLIVVAGLTFWQFGIVVMSDLKNRWDGSEMVEARLRVLGQESEELRRTVEEAYGTRKAGKDTSGDWIVLMRLPNFFEDLGLKVKRQHLTLRSVNDWFGTNIVREWQRWEDAIKWLQTESNQPTGGEDFKKLAQRLIRLRERR